MDCLVTKLKATVNNPNLPVFETMQQFTLDVITASGNASMTDAQKYALNHFFYAIGAIDNSATWQKLLGLAMPLICGDNLSKAARNYVTNEDNAASNNAQFVNHGLVSTLQKVGTYSGNAVGLAAIFISTVELESYEGSVSVGVVQDSSNGGVITFGQNQDTSYTLSTHSVSNRSSAVGPIDGVAGRTTSSEFESLFSIDGRIINKTTSRSNTYSDMSNKNLFFSSVTAWPLGIHIAGKDLSSAELRTLFEAALELKNYWLA